VLATPQITVPIGKTVVLLDKAVPVRNAFPDLAKIKDTWTVKPFNADADEMTVKYGVRGRRGP
jgi:hypothetical protein